MAEPMDVDILTPPASAASPTPSTASVLARAPPALPTPRRHPLPQGSAKEIKLIHYLDSQLLRVVRRYEKRLPEEQRTGGAPEDAPGYQNMDQVLADLDPLVDVVWISHTPPLQVAYLLSIAGHICSYMTAFPFTSAIFATLRKIDQAFVFLLKLPSPAPGTPAALHPPSKTDRVRIKSLAEETRVVAVNTATKSGVDIDDFSSDDEFEDTFANGSEAQGESAVGTGLGGVFQGTIEILGDTLT